MGDHWANTPFIPPLAPYAGPRGRNDPGRPEAGTGGATDTEDRGHVTLWAMRAAPLLIGTDLRPASPQTYGVLRGKGVWCSIRTRWAGRRPCWAATAGGGRHRVTPRQGD
ncbi:hypothetical protein ACGH2B_25615 [Streptomyces sp. BBFR2]|uniref:hypothetical protein n=1 Tax=Streptomyces sp. BBFR2 TaxID=3372854 RepID=UPI0037D9FBFE